MLQSHNYHTPPTHTHTHVFLFILLAHVTQPRSTHAPSTFYFCDHNYLMMELLVSPSCFCTHDLAVNNLARGARTVVHQNSRCRQDTGRAGSLFIWSSTHLLTRSSSRSPSIPSSARPCLLSSGVSASCWCWVGRGASWVDWSSPAVAMEKPQRKPNQRYEGTKPRKVRYLQTTLVASQLFCSVLS